MKNILHFICILSISIITLSCSKDSSSAPVDSYYLTAKFDGTTKQFNTTVGAFKTNIAEGMYNLTITGISGLGVGAEQGTIILWSEKDDFTAGKVFTIEALGGTTYNVLTYNTTLGISDLTKLWTSTYIFGGVPETFTCTITESTSTYIKGTFSGVIYQNDIPVNKKTVTEGQFFAKFQ